MSLAGAGTIAVALASFLLLSDKPKHALEPLTEPVKRFKLGSGSEVWTSVVWNLITQQRFICICFIYMLVSLVRGACTDWGQLYLIQDKHHSQLTGSSFTSSHELGGIMGSLAAGYASDFLMSKSFAYNPRLLVIFICTVIMSASVFFFMAFISTTSSTLLISMAGFSIGFGIYGTIALVGVVAMESTVDKLAGTAHSVVSLAANLGLVLSGYPLSLVAKHYSWHTTFILVQLVAVLTTVVAFLGVHTTPVTISQRVKTR